VQKIIVKPQEKQFLAMQAAADIVIFGGAAGGGKSWCLLHLILPYLNNKHFKSVIFRRTRPELTQPGGLWPASHEIYYHFGGKPKQSPFLRWNFPSGATINFSHLQHEKNIYDWQGSEITLIGFDELTHFTETQFFYLLSRNRCTSGIRPRIWCTTNPDANSWVAKFITPWLNNDKNSLGAGFIDPVKDGKKFWFIRGVSDQIIWGNSKSELLKIDPESLPKSVIFINSKIHDNPQLLKKDPNYLSNLKNLALINRERLLHGNWKIEASGGKIFNNSWFKIKSQLPKKLTSIISGWDFAATGNIEGHDPDYTARVLIGLDENSEYWILDCFASQINLAESYKNFERIIKEDNKIAQKFECNFAVRWETEPGSAAKRESYFLRKILTAHGFNAAGVSSTKNKIFRAMNFAKACEDRLVNISEANWNDEFINHLHHQPDLKHDDIMDAASLAFNELVLYKNKTEIFTF
jgi:predicted phage terminase large subunit-like protein